MADKSGYASASYAELPYAGTGAGLAVTVSLTGVSASSAVGSSTVVANSNLPVTGVSAASAIGSAQINFAFTVDGVSAASTVSQVTVWSVIDTSQTPSWAEISASQTPSWIKIAA